MPYKNVRRLEGDEAFYHVYNRGANKMGLFLDEADYEFFEGLLARLLAPQPRYDDFGRAYKNFHGAVELLAYCLMPNHFHLLLKQQHSGQIAEMMRSLAGGYSMYFNRKYRRKGAVYESRYKSVLLSTTEQLRHVSRYIHLNPVEYERWAHSSYDDYLYEPRDWLAPARVLETFRDTGEYSEYVDDYEDVKRENEKNQREIGEY